MPYNQYNPYTQGRGWGYTGSGYGSNWYSGGSGGGGGQQPPYSQERYRPVRQTQQRAGRYEAYKRRNWQPPAPRDIGGYGTKQGYEPGRKSPARGGAFAIFPTTAERTKRRREQGALKQERGDELATLRYEAEVSRLKQEAMGYQQPEMPSQEMPPQEMPPGQGMPGGGAGFQQMMTQNPWMMQMFQQFLLQNPWMQQMGTPQEEEDRLPPPSRKSRTTNTKPSWWGERGQITEAPY